MNICSLPHSLHQTTTHCLNEKFQGFFYCILSIVLRVKQGKLLFFFLLQKKQENLTSSNF